AGATAAHELARAGHSVLLLDRGGRIKPCGGAVPPILLREFDVPEHLLEGRVTEARMISPVNREVDMDIGGFVGMVDRAEFDPWLRQRAADAGADLRQARCLGVDRDDQGRAVVRFSEANGDGESHATVRAVIGADGANSMITKRCIPGNSRIPHVYAYHEIVASPEPGGDTSTTFDPTRCDVYYQGRISPDFYGWVFPHGAKTSIGTGTAKKGNSLKQAVALLRESAGLENAETVRCEGAPIPLKALKRWDNGRDVLVIGDAAGAVAPSSGEGIYYAMFSGRQGADAVHEFLATGDARCLKQARQRFMKAHGRVFFILGIMQYFWYSSDLLRERFVKICRDPDVQKLTWEAYMNKKLVRKKPMAHVRIFFKDLAHLIGLAPR
ncbi:MAG: geranylgeranyl diphosphate reductase, partial [Xanthomonadales bacterium]|nr:geranylgeranyl diphosphate reductase [Xanthomonadales bacterium]